MLAVGPNSRHISLPLPPSPSSPPPPPTSFALLSQSTRLSLSWWWALCSDASSIRVYMQENRRERKISPGYLNIPHEFSVQRDLDSNLLRLSFHFKNCGLWILSCDFVPHNYQTLKWLSLLPILMQKSFRWWQCSDRYIISLSPHLHTPPPPSPRP